MCGYQFHVQSTHLCYSTPIRSHRSNSDVLDPLLVDGHLVFQQITVYNLPQHLVVHSHCFDIVFDPASNALPKYH